MRARHLASEDGCSSGSGYRYSCAARASRLPQRADSRPGTVGAVVMHTINAPMRPKCRVAGGPAPRIDTKTLAFDCGYLRDDVRPWFTWPNT
jgi:hypothetical protein